MIRTARAPENNLVPQRRLPGLALLTLLLALTLASTASAEPTPNPARRIPEVHTLSFSGDRVDLPAMVDGKLAILILGFSKGARTQATLWGRRLPTDYFYSRDVLYYEMPVLQSVPRLLRGAVLRSIKSDVSVRSQPHFAPVITDEQRWRSLVHFNKPDDAYVLLIDSAGFIQAQFQGEPTDKSYQELKHRVEQIQSTPSH